jgi:hypothetical protein
VRAKRPAVKRSTRVRGKATVITKIPTAKERFKAGHRSECDVCNAKIGAKLPGGKKVEIWSFTVKGANGKIFNRCKRHLKMKAVR